MRINWQQLSLSHESFHPALVEAFATPPPPTHFLAFQPRLRATLQRFVQLRGHSQILCINTPDHPAYRKELVTSLQALPAALTLLSGPVLQTETLALASLLGYYHLDTQGEIRQKDGLLQQAQSGYLVISANLILLHPTQWPKIKAAILGHEIELEQRGELYTTTPPCAKFDVQVIITGNHQQLAAIDALDEGLLNNNTSLYCEIELETSLTAENAITYIHFIQTFLQQQQSPLLQDANAALALLQAGSRYTEDQNQLPLCLLWHQGLLAEAAVESNQTAISAAHIDAALAQRYYRHSYLQDRILADVIDGKITIKTSGTQIGQVNALTMSQYPGHPMPYGETVRLSCVINLGEGEVSDIERKVELSGPLHTKGMLIMQAFITQALQCHGPLPYAASITFEQSYSEIDGDSASLAELCVLISALAQQPIYQHVALTGSIDQFGAVQAIGGVNEKIEGFFRLCRHRGLTHQQGVIIPTSNVTNLSLSKDIIEAVQQGKFHLWQVDSAPQAIEILTGQPFYGDQPHCLVQRIATQIEKLAHKEQGISSWLDRFKSRLGWS